MSVISIHMELSPTSSMCLPLRIGFDKHSCILFNVRSHTRPDLARPDLLNSDTLDSPGHSPAVSVIVSVIISFIVCTAQMKKRVIGQLLELVSIADEHAVKAEKLRIRDRTQNILNDTAVRSAYMSSGIAFLVQYFYSPNELVRQDMNAALQ